KNEECNIEECLRSVHWVTERLVIDAESDDRTVELARAAGAAVHVRPWPGFGPQKNVGIELARSEWILILDADERVPTALQEEILGCLNRWTPGSAAAYRIPRRNLFYGAWVRYGGVFPDYQIRLFRKGTARYNDAAVHENLIVDGEIGTLVHPLDHYTERRIKDHFRKFSQYTTLAAAEKSKTTCRVSALDLLMRPLVVFLKTYGLKHGFRDGVRGLIVCTFASMYTFVKYAKLWDANRRGIVLEGFR
ncbi:MAG TPA: glycosyltransferase family 2 protein, partial [Nitrospira sp.]|nr:glycosyltransferase family 2 protein [Nitrospira sp.]